MKNKNKEFFELTIPYLLSPTFGEKNSLTWTLPKTGEWEGLA